MTDNKLILVTGATGRQGGATARALRQRGFRVRALTRDASKPAAETLRAEGIDTVEGDLNEPSSVRPYLTGVDGVFAALNFWEASYDGEVRQGRGLIDSAQAASVSRRLSAASPISGTGFSTAMNFPASPPTSFAIASLARRTTSASPKAPLLHWSDIPEDRLRANTSTRSTAF